MEVGLGVLGLAPAEFWALTMPEFVTAIDGWREARGIAHAAGAPPTRAEIVAMMHRFPDREGPW